MTYPKTNPRDVRDAIHVADPAIDSNATAGSGHAVGTGVQARVTREVLEQMVGAANDAVERQQAGGSGHSKP
jgi:hypothetical protein